MDLVTMATAFFNEQAPEQNMRRPAQQAALPKRSFAEHLEEAVNNGITQSAPGTHDTEPEAGYVA